MIFFNRKKNMPSIFLSFFVVIYKFLMYALINSPEKRFHLSTHLFKRGWNIFYCLPSHSYVFHCLRLLCSAKMYGTLLLLRTGNISELRNTIGSIYGDNESQNKSKGIVVHKKKYKKEEIICAKKSNFRVTRFR